MSRMPTGTLRFSSSSILAAKRRARGTPRRRMPTKANLSRSLVFSRISWARRTRVRSISEALINWAFSRVKGMEAKRSSVTHVQRRLLWIAERRPGGESEIVERNDVGQGDEHQDGQFRIHSGFFKDLPKRNNNEGRNQQDGYDLRESDGSQGAFPPSRW